MDELTECSSNASNRNRPNPISPDQQCEADGCDTDPYEEGMRIVIRTSAEIEGKLYDDWNIHFCSVECLNEFLSQSFPLTGDSPTDPTIFEPDGPTPQQESVPKSAYHENVVAAIEDHRTIEFGPDGDVVFPHLDDDADHELKFAAYFDNPMDDDDPYLLGHPRGDSPRTYVDGQRLDLPEKQMYDTYTAAKKRASKHAAAMDLGEGARVLMFVPGTSYSTFISAST